MAASVGSYGAYLADGSEYSGLYGENIDVAKLKDFHRQRLKVLAGASPDILAFETIPNRLETQAIVELLEEENIHIPSWICFSSVDGEHAASGESFEECLNVINQSKKVVMVGINCAPPYYVDGLIRKFKELTDMMIVVYPNSGEIWDGKAKRWLSPQCSEDNEFGSLALRWRDSGAKLIGGCCRTSPATIRDISKSLKGKP